MSTPPDSAWLGWHLDFHTPGYTPVSAPSQPDEFARAFSEAGVSEVILFAKCHFGFSYYPTKVGVPHPQMQGDVFGSLLQACRDRDIKVLAYISFGIDGQAAEAHPEWAQRNPQGISGRPGHFHQICPFTAYLDQSVLPQIEELVRLYHPDGFWFDTMSALAPCFCESCKAAFRSEHGYEIPGDANVEPYAAFGQWRHRRGISLIKRVAKYIHELEPKLDVGFNQIGSLPYPEPLPDDVTMLSLDPATYGAQSVQFSLNVAYGVATGKVCDVMPTIFNSGWGDWSLATPLRIEQTAAAIWARGGRLHAGDRLHPTGVLTPETRKGLNILGDQRERMSTQLPSADAVQSPDILLLHSTSSSYGEDDEWFAVGDTRERLKVLAGAHRLLLDAGANYCVVGASFLENWLPRCKLAVVPEITTVAEATSRVLRSYLEEGGRLLMIGAPPKGLEWCGVTLNEVALHDHIYLPSVTGDSTPVLVRGAFHIAQCNAAETVLAAIEPYAARPDHKFGWGIAPPNQDVSCYPALTRCRIGEGEVFWLGAPICSDYAAQGNWQQFRWMADLLGALTPQRRAWLENDYGSIELVLWENERSTWAILINHHGEQLSEGKMAWSRVTGPLPAVPIQLHVRAWSGLEASVNASGWEFSASDDGIVLRGVLKSVWDIIRIDWNR